MPKLAFKNPRFIKSATKAKDYPILKTPSGKLMPEIAVAGRSNVGKSSLLNHLFQKRDMVKTSSIPGKTQLINFFVVDDGIAFVDLPGYGYAQVPMEVRKKWGPMIQEYLDGRPALRLILLLFDIRRTPTQEDKVFIEWVSHRQKAMILVLTKVDKVTQNEKKANTQKILQAFNCQNLYHIHTSTTKDIGRRELIGLINEALEDEQQEEEKGDDGAHS
jgi:GTP-binding protein